MRQENCTKQGGNVACNIVFFFLSIARGQKIPIFSAAGLPHNDVSLAS